MIDRENTSPGWLLAGVLTATVLFNVIALALNTGTNGRRPFA
jgi:hypothetical protein